jgi:hypothetical protein
MVHQPIDIERMARIYSETPDQLSDTELEQFVRAIASASKRQIGTEDRHILAGYLSLRAIEKSLDRRIWAGFGRAELAKGALGEQTGKGSIGFGPRRERVATSLKAAFFAGELTLYVAADEARFRERGNEVPSWAKEPVPVPKELLGHVFVKGRLSSTFAIRPSRKRAGNDRLFALLNCGHLVVREKDFKRWVQSERCKHRWPSQKDAQRAPVGRPKRLNARVEKAILEIAREQVWIGDRDPITKLHGLLNKKGIDVPSVDTLVRIVDELFATTGEPELRRRRRSRRK